MATSTPEKSVVNGIFRAHSFARGDLGLIHVLDLGLMPRIGADLLAHLLVAFDRTRGDFTYGKVHTLLLNSELSSGLEVMILEAMLAYFDPHEEAATNPEVRASVARKTQARLVVDEARHDSIPALLARWSGIPDTDACVIFFEDASAENLFLYEVAARLREHQPRPVTLVLGHVPSLGDDEHEMYDSVYDLRATIAQTVSELVSERFPQWVKKLQNHDDHKVLADIDRCTKRQPSETTARLKVQALAAAGRTADAWQLAKSSVLDDSPRTLTLLAHIAIEVADTRAASRLFERAFAQPPVDTQSLRILHGIGERLGLYAKSNAILAQLSEQEPDDPNVFRLLFDHAISNDDWPEVGRLVSSPLSESLDVDRKAYYDLRVKFELEGMTADEFMRRVQEETPNYETDTLGLLARRALSDNDVVAAVLFLIDGRLTPQLGIVWCDVFERTLAVYKGTNIELPFAPLLPLLMATKTLAQNPTAIDLRRAVAELFNDPGTSLLATYWLAHVIQDAEVDAPLSTPTGPEVFEEERLFEQYIDQYQRFVLAARPKKSAMSMLPEDLPRSMAVEYPESVYWAIYRYIAFGCSIDVLEGDTITDSPAIFWALKSGLDLTRALSEHADLKAIDLIAIAGCHFAAANKFQIARNLGETILNIAATNIEGPEKDLTVVKAAWLEYADIYLRCHNVTEAALAVACSVLCDTKMERAQDKLQEARLYIRLLRELRVPSMATKLADKLVDALADDPTGLEQARYLRLSIKSNAVSDIEQLLQEGAEMVQISLQHGSELMPTTSLLAQFIRWAKMSKVEVPSHVLATISSALSKLQDHERSFVEDLMSQSLNLEGLLDRATQLYRGAAFVEDLASDRWSLDVLSSRLLADLIDQGDLQAASAFVVIELMADVSFRHVNRDPAESAQDRILGDYRERAMRGLAMDPAILRMLSRPIGATTSPTLSLTENPQILYDSLQNWAASGLEIHSLAIAEGGVLAHASVLAGGDLRCCREDGFDVKAFTAWVDAGYPRSIVDPHRERQLSDAEVCDKMKELSIASVPSPGVISLFVTDVHLSIIPVNLLLRGGRLGGSIGPVAKVPSLAWLINAQSRPPRETGVVRLWFFSSSTADSDAIGYLRGQIPKQIERTRVELCDWSQRKKTSQHLGFVVVHGQTDMTNSEVTHLIDGHGNIHDPDTIVDFLSDTEVVVLLACSGGASTAARHAAKTTGLPRTFLDHGARAVVASPWLLSADLVLCWIGPFVRTYEAGRPLGLAVHEANLAARDGFPEPAFWLAMHVFGDPTICLPDLRAGGDRE